MTGVDGQINRNVVQVYVVKAQGGIYIQLHLLLA
jgi:hypothetical protein